MPLFLLVWHFARRDGSLTIRFWKFFCKRCLHISSFSGRMIFWINLSGVIHNFTTLVLMLLPNKISACCIKLPEVQYLDPINIWNENVFCQILKKTLLFFYLMQWRWWLSDVVWMQCSSRFQHILIQNFLKCFSAKERHWGALQKCTHPTTSCLSWSNWSLFQPKKAPSESWHWYFLHLPHFATFLWHFTPKLIWKYSTDQNEYFL